MKFVCYFALALSTLFFLVADGSTIDEKLSSLSADQDVTDGELGGLEVKLNNLRGELKLLYSEAEREHLSGSNVGNMQNILREIRNIKREIEVVEEEWRLVAIGSVKSGKIRDNIISYESAPISQIAMEYGAKDYIYIVPQELNDVKISLHTDLPISSSSWEDLLEIFFAHNGIGVKQLNPYVKQLYMLSPSIFMVDFVITSWEHLCLVPDNGRVAYVLPVHHCYDVKQAFQFFERFKDAVNTAVYQIGYRIVILSTKSEVVKLLQLYDAVWERSPGRSARIVPLSKLHVDDAKDILISYFGYNPSNRSRGGGQSGKDEQLVSFRSLKNENAIALIGDSEFVERGAQVLASVENQINDPDELIVYWYKCLHNDPVELASMFERVYCALIGEENRVSDSVQPFSNDETLQTVNFGSKRVGSASSGISFIPYPQSGSVMMVVRRGLFDRLLELIKSVDIPKKMVRIEVLLFEKRITGKNRFGINWFKLGQSASDSHVTRLNYGGDGDISDRGVMSFLLSRVLSRGHTHGYLWSPVDIAYHFLMGQEDVRINSAPSVTTLDQKPALISLVKEISLDTGTTPVEVNGEVVSRHSYTRASYGTVLEITPSVHGSDPESGIPAYITLDSQVSFDTIQRNSNSDRPWVTRRQIHNHVRVADGETVVLGGLREKSAEDTRYRVPFLGEIPGFGKLFATSEFTNEESETFIFITPRIVVDSVGQREEARMRELMMRPGDIPEFLERAERAKQIRKLIFGKSFRLLFGGING